MTIIVTIPLHIYALLDDRINAVNDDPIDNDTSDNRLDDAPSDDHLGNPLHVIV